MFPADAAGDLPDREHHHAAGKVHHGQGVPAEGGADETGVPDPAPQRGAVQGYSPVQVRGGAGRVWKTDPSRVRTSRPTVHRALGGGLGFWGCL